MLLDTFKPSSITSLICIPFMYVITAPHTYMCCISYKTSHNQQQQKNDTLLKKRLKMFNNEKRNEIHKKRKHKQNSLPSPPWGKMAALVHLTLLELFKHYLLS